MSYNNQFGYDFNPDYPYGDFPIEYTKHGKEELRKRFEQKQKDYASQTLDYKHKDEVKHSTNSSGMTLDIKMLLPLIKAMSSKGKVGTGDLMKAMLPMIGGDNKNLGEIIGAFERITKPADKHPSKIESYTRVDEEKQNTEE